MAKKKLKWLGYYCKVFGFEVHGRKDGPTLELDLELLEAVPKVETLALTVYGRDSEWRIEKEWTAEGGSEQKVVRVGPDLGAHASRRPTGAVNVTVWWKRESVKAMMDMLLSGHQVYVSFDAREFYRNNAEVTGVEWWTLGAWRSDVVGEESDLY